MGSVYLAQDTQLYRRVALKVPHFLTEDGPEMRQRFYREARAAAMLSHAALCPVYDVGEADGVPFLTMAYIEGTPLEAAGKDGELRAPLEAVALIHRLARGLDEAHRHGVVHRDLKPANVMVTLRNEPIVVDFGLALHAVHQNDRLTQRGVPLGTPAYMPPEQVKGDLAAMGPGCDIYSLGVILYELLTGRLPYEGDPMTILARIVTEEPPPPSIHRAEIDPSLDALCLKAMARRVEDRYATMGEFAEELAAYRREQRRQLADSDVGSVAGSLLQLLWIWILLGLVVVLLVLGVAAFLFYRAHAHPSDQQGARNDVVGGAGRQEMRA
jgi:serine/threonine protein kinase